MITRLEVINAMLQAVGQAIVTSDANNNPDVQQAGNALDGYVNKILSKRWWFNENYNVTLVPDQLGKILLPANCLSVTVNGCGYYVQRGSTLFDPVNTTDIIGKSVQADIRVNMPLDQIPASVAEYIKAYSIHRFYVDDDGDADKANDYLNERNIAKVDADSENLFQLRLNSNMSPKAQSILWRIRPTSKGPGSWGQNPRYPGGNPYR